MDPLLDLIDHPPQDPTPAHDPVFTAQVMSRVTRRSKVASPTLTQWMLIAMISILVVGLGWSVPVNLGELDLGIDSTVWIEVIVTACLALPFLCSRRRLA